MNKDLTKFVNCWVAKKSKKPLCREHRPAFYVGRIRVDNRTGQQYFRVDSKRSIAITKALLPEFEIISKAEALRLNKMFHESEFVANVNSDAHIREDTQQPKKAFDPGTFQAALYELKLKFPDKECIAYVCNVCGKIHLGKS